MTFIPTVNPNVVILSCFFSAGHCIHFDASQSEQSARFVAPSNINLYACLKFHYHMTGLHVGRLNVYTTDLRGNEELIWRLFGDQNDTWKEGHVPVNVIHTQYQVNMAFCRLIQRTKVICMHVLKF